METFKVTIYTPEKLFGSFDTVSLTCNAPDGEICVMRDHMPMLLAIREGVMRIRTPEETIRVFTGDGAVFVKNNEARVFTDVCVPAEAKNLSEVRERMKHLHETDTESPRRSKEHAVKLARISDALAAQSTDPS